MNAFVISSFFTAGSTIILGFFVLSQNPKDKVNQAWFFTTFAVFINWFGLGMIGISLNPTQALFWQRILYIGTIFIPIFFFHFCVLFLKKDGKIVKNLLGGGYVLSVVFAFLSFSDLFIVKIGEKTAFNYWPVETGILYPLFLLYFIVYVIYPIALLYINRKRSSGVFQKQVDYIYYAALIGFVGGSTNFLLDFNLNIYPIGNFFVTFYVVFITYAILKHHLFSLKIIATELLTFAIWIFLLMRVLLADTFKDQLIDGSLLVLLIIFGIFLIRSVIHEVEQREKIEKLAGDLEKANIRLTELDRQKSEFVSFATHQLRAPLTAMKGYASLIIEGDTGAITDQTKQAVGRIFESTNTLASIVDDYLNITRIELGTMRYAFDTIDLKGMIEDVIAELKPNIDKSKLAFSFEAENTGTDYRITADRDKLKQVIANLVDNSIKYTPQGWVKATLSMDQASHKFVFKVADNGIGIAPETLPLLFQKFSRAGNANKTNIKGTGLGLYVAKQIIEAHHATIRAESPGEGKGSTFIVEFEPFAKA